MASNEAVQTAGSLARAFGDLLNPRISRIVLASILLTVAALAVLWTVMAWLLTGFEFFRWGWANWIVDTFTGLAIFFAALLVAPAVLLMITGFFLSYVVAAVERRHYPHLPAARDIPIAEDIAGVLRFTGLLLLLNLLVLPLYLLLPGINFLVSWTLNGYLAGREYYDLVAMRRLAKDERTALRRANGGRVFRAGFAIAMLMTVPVLNLVMPVVAAAYMTHVFHAIRERTPQPGSG